MRSNELNRKIEQAIKLIRVAARQAKSLNQKLEISYSGGKDSDVILELARMAKVDYVAKYRNTTIDPKGTILHCKGKGVEILRPKKNFLQCVEQSGFPTMFRRHCCGYLKEYKVNDVVIIGVRRCESKRRMERYSEPVECRYYDRHHKKQEMAVQAYYPILYWTNENISEFITKRHISIHPLYYDNNGKFQVTKRLGCIGCPMVSNEKRIKQFKQNPNHVKLWIRGGRKYIQNHIDKKDNSVWRNFDGDVYRWFVMQLFCSNMNEFREKFQQLDCRKFLEDYFNIQFKD